MLLLVNDRDEIIGQEEKLKTHQAGFLHRAFSVYVMDRTGRVLLQQRALSKYHSGGLRANTCCSHQMLDEDHEAAGHRRLMEEMGFDCQMKKVTEFVYKVDVPPGLIEHEYLHVFVGLYNGEIINPNPEEVMSYSRLTVEQLMKAVENDDRSLAPWTKITRRLAKDRMEEVWKSML